MAAHAGRRDAKFQEQERVMDCAGKQSATALSNDKTAPDSEFKVEDEYGTPCHACLFPNEPAPDCILRLSAGLMAIRLLGFLFPHRKELRLPPPPSKKNEHQYNLRPGGTPLSFTAR